MRKITDNIICCAIAGAAAYVVIAWIVFSFRHPLCNGAAFYRHFSEMVRFQTVEGYGR